jgi:hypothetical protein
VTDPKVFTDLLGVAGVGKAVGETVKLIVEKGLDASGQLFNMLCRPAAEELGAYFEDGIRRWRLKNVNAVAAKALPRITEGGEVHPEIAHELFEAASWVDDDGLQDMWAGLIASACEAGAKDLSSKKYIDMLRRLSPEQCAILRFVACRSPLRINKSGLVVADVDVYRDLKPFEVRADELAACARIADPEELDVTVDHMTDLGILGLFSGFQQDGQVRLLPSTMGLALYARCMGQRSARTFYAKAARVDEREA